MKDERVYLGHIRDPINDLEEYTSVGREAFVAERMRQNAVIRKIETLFLCLSRMPTVLAESSGKRAA